MASNATERINRVFDKLKEEGIKLDQPFRVPKRARVRVKPPPRKVVEKKTGCYCRDTYDELPVGFVSCHGCPVDSEPPVV